MGHLSLLRFHKQCYGSILSQTYLSSALVVGTYQKNGGERAQIGLDSILIGHIFAYYGLLNKI